MEAIPSSRTPVTPNRLIECEEALEASFQQLLWRAVDAGWDEEESTAIAMLADNHILAIERTPPEAAAIKRVRIQA